MEVRLGGHVRRENASASNRYCPSCSNVNVRRFGGKCGVSTRMNDRLGRCSAVRLGCCPMASANVNESEAESESDVLLSRSLD